ncbi:MAG: SDR family oxidoreductase [Planctomycetota bacterium]|jgi:3-oxoacyl-[acyl-carrier protein] reductase
MDIQGSRALVTGGATGIGKAIATLLREKGAEVGLMGRRRDVLQAAADELGALALPGDVGVEADAAGAVAAFTERFGGIDVLVNNAGWGRFVPLVEMQKDVFEAVMNTNVTGAMLMAREAARHFVRQGSGNIVNIASTSGLRGGAGSSAYSASKFALRALSECWRAELRPSNVRVIHVNPSEVLTGFGAAAGYEQQPSPRKLIPEDIALAVVSALQMHDRGFIPELSVWATNPF